MNNIIFVVRFSYKMYYGFKIMSLEQFDAFSVALAYIYSKYKADNKKFNLSEEHSDTNANISADEFFDCFSVEMLYSDDIKILEKAFNIDDENAWGIFPKVEDIFEACADEIN